MNDVRGRTNDAYADNPYFGINAVDEPGVAALSALALLVCVMARRRK